MDYHRTILMIEGGTDGSTTRAIDSAADMVVFDFERPTPTEDAIDDITITIEKTDRRVGFAYRISPPLRGLEVSNVMPTLRRT